MTDSQNLKLIVIIDSFNIKEVKHTLSGISHYWLAHLALSELPDLFGTGGVYCSAQSANDQTEPVTFALSVQ